ncbi:MAG TPA: sugar phosphate isomerase/epimerase [Candidatus Latescibacteria bacterium]|nr:sugar phosphate isomerase/epimerase [Candidatus Latescibacterota bacterium]
MKLSCQEGMVPGKSLEEKVANLERYGFDGIEIFGSDLVERKKEVIAATKGRKVRPSSICTGYRGCLLSPDRQERDLALRDIKELLGICAEIGAEGLIVVPIFGEARLPDLAPYKTVFDLEQDLLIDLLGDLSRYAEKVGSVILLEPLNRYETHFMNRIEDAVRIAKRINSPAVKVMADFFHMNIEEKTIPEAMIYAGTLLAHVHLADSTRFLPGWGHTDFRAALDALKRMGYQKYMAFECGVPGDPEVLLPRTVRYLRELM